MLVCDDCGDCGKSCDERETRKVERVGRRGRVGVGIRVMGDGSAMGDIWGLIGIFCWISVGAISMSEIDVTAWRS